MPSFRTIARRAGLVAVPSAALLAVLAPSAFPSPAYDSQGYLDSTARCSAPDAAVVFGRTASSRVAICVSPDGDYQYRGVRVRDGAKLITTATRSSDGAFEAVNDGIEYMVTSSALVVSSGQRVIRDEPMLDFHRPSASSAPSAPATSSTPSAPPATSTPPTTATPTTSLPPPLPAERGAS